MHNSKTIRLLKNLNGYEIRRLDDLIRSPYFNKDQEVINLWDKIRKYHPDYSNSNLKKESFIQSSSKIKNLSFKKTNKLLFKLSALVEEYIVQEQLKREEKLKCILKLRYYEMEANLIEFNTEKKRSIKICSKDINNFNDFYLLFSIHYTSFINHEIKTSIDAISSFELSNTYLDSFYLGMKLKSINTVESFKTSYKTDLKIELEKEVLNYCNNNYTNIHILLKGYFKIVKASKEKLSHISYTNTKKFITENLNSFGNEKYSLFVFLLNYSSLLRLEKDQISLYKEKLELYKFGLQKGVLLEQDHLHHIHFLNILKLSCRLKEFGFANTFYRDYAPYLAEDYTDYENYSKICIWFYQEKYSEVVSFIFRNKILFKDHRLKQDIKIYLIKSYHYLEDIDNLFLAIESYLKFIKRNRYFSKNFQLAGINFAKIMVKFYNTLSYENQVLEELLHTVRQISPILNRDWISTEILKKINPNQL